ncbi:TRAP-type C4-dicarboxylate transport system, small permease component [Fulvimarina manganoxydans]|uniref:TRAP transporter small permease protein n=1 Tax=Fulvimarina manganoxydans TaxID=937218 RepID=A0A1W1ZDH7_9HYPH|nr:TRAP transporter small permease [Fulvimarina manganoxydans]MEE2950461.1 TRAP transporter small permease [Pseudomonadota bacterium]SMC46444.1 TRAP-type C4-dicarboxylate transport system, small permease component [Fulvimarina manganoxydans]
MTHTSMLAEPVGWRRSLRRPDLFLAEFLLIALVVISSLGVFMRYVMNTPLVWTEEISGIVIVWMTFAGAVGLTRQNLHARVELLDEFLPSTSRFKAGLDILLDIVAVLFLVPVVIGGWDLIAMLSHERTPALRLPIGIQLAAIPIAGALMIAFLSAKVVRAGIALARGANP